MRRDDCIFCKLANGDIPTNSIYEDEDFKVILDMAPAAKGHALILPKSHFDNIYDMDSEILGKAVQLGQKVIKHATEVLGCQGYNVVQNNGEVAGQTVFHFHMHLIPRYEDMDNSSLLKWAPIEISGDELKEIAEAIQLEK